MPEGIQEYRTSIAPPQSSRKPRHHEMRRNEIVDFVSTDPTKPKTKKEICEHLRSTDQFKDTKETGGTLGTDLRELAKEGSGPLVSVGTAAFGVNRGWILREYESEGQAFFEGGEKQQRNPRINWKVRTGGLILAVLYAEDAKAQEDATSDEGAAPNSSGVTSQPKVHVTAEGVHVTAGGVLAEMAKSGLGNDVITFYQDHANKAYAIEQVRSCLVGFCSTYSSDVVNEASRGSGLFKLSKHLPQHHSIYSPPSTLAFNLHGHQTVQQFYAFWVLTDSVFIVRHIMQHRVAVHLRGNSKKKQKRKKRTEKREQKKEK